MSDTVNPTRVMVDIETMGNTPGSIILTLGAVKFDSSGITDTFYRRIDPESCERFGLKPDVSTILWWFKQPDEARLEITYPGVELSQALTEFGEWLGDPMVEIWGNGASFDNTVLAAAYRACEIPLPWRYSRDRCYRTMKAMHPEVAVPDRVGTHHNALDDAMNQALHLIEIFKKLSLE
ncbi:3'-5' exoribonuclease [Luteolibacter pohnpeiensis]|uniref:3'-5' exoribonuclease n=1 Tax=Luteolibacter pohnpeiensis TaxID=454153 RepID=A0A934SEW8_9BACT|nr:3'-5' exonuclease [Luteolibacter pohnpeiensis]MBK1884634.1 3'-5' exoribonuclease [Luteolibacter pohnpeiensis]